MMRDTYRRSVLVLVTREQCKHADELILEKSVRRLGLIIRLKQTPAVGKDAAEVVNRSVTQAVEPGCLVVVTLVCRCAAVMKLAQECIRA